MRICICTQTYACAAYVARETVKGMPRVSTLVPFIAYVASYSLYAHQEHNHNVYCMITCYITHGTLSGAQQYRVLMMILQSHRTLTQWLDTSICEVIMRVLLTCNNRSVIVYLFYQVSFQQSIHRRNGTLLKWEFRHINDRTKASTIGQWVLFTEETLTVVEIYSVAHSRVLPI